MGGVSAVRSAAPRLLAERLRRERPGGWRWPARQPAGSVQNSRASIPCKRTRPRSESVPYVFGDRGHIGSLGRGVVALQQVGDDIAEPDRVAIVELGAHLERDPAAAAAARSAAEVIEEATGRHHATIVHPPCAMG